MPETEFLNNRKRAIEAVACDTEAVRATQLTRTALPGAHVPPDTDKFVTDEIGRVRTLAQKRQREKEKVIRSVHDDIPVETPGGEAKRIARMGVAQRWRTAGPARPPNLMEGGRTHNQLVLLHERAAAQWPQVLQASRGWTLHKKLGSWCRAVASATGRSAYQHRCVVVDGLHAGILESCRYALAVRLLGGFFTTIGEVKKSTHSRDVPAMGVWFRGIIGVHRVAMSAEFLASKTTKFHILLLEYMAASSGILTILTSRQLEEEVKEYVSRKGSKSQPWRTFSLLVTDAGEEERMRTQWHEFPSVVHSFENWLSSRSPALTTIDNVIFW